MLTETVSKCVKSALYGGWGSLALDMLNVPRLDPAGVPIISAEMLRRRMRRFPVRKLGAILAPGDVMILAPHPDDEAIGCGGLIAQAQAQGRAAHLVFLSDGARGCADPARRGATLAAVREREAHAAACVLDVPPERRHFFRLPDRSVPSAGDEFDAIVRALTSMLCLDAIGTIVTTTDDDPHPDHKAACRIAQAAAERSGAKLLCFPVWTWRTPRNRSVLNRVLHGSRLDVRPQLALKRAALAAHATQVSAGMETSLESEAGAVLFQLATLPFETYIEF
jgi:LmbE family N-acetylglucosaminyl deacetylase